LISIDVSVLTKISPPSAITYPYTDSTYYLYETIDSIIIEDSDNWYKDLR